MGRYLYDHRLIDLGGWHYRRWRRKMRADLDDVWHKPETVAERALRLLDGGPEEVHVPVSYHPHELEKEVQQLHDVGLVVVGLGPYGPNAFLRAAVRRKGGPLPPPVPDEGDVDYDTED